LLILQLAWRERTARAAIVGIAATPPDNLPPVKRAVEEGRAVNERNRAVQAISNRDLRHPEPAWKKGEQGLRAIRLRVRDRKCQDRKEAFQATDSPRKLELKEAAE
jgi:hypothetical protein